LSLVLDIALAHLRRRRRQTAVSVLGVALGVGFFIAVAGMMQGFQDYFVRKVIDVQPHITMMDQYRGAPLQPAMALYGNGAVDLSGLRPRDEPRGIRNGNAVVAELRRLPGVMVAPSLSGQIFLRYGSKDVSANIVGIEPEAERRISNIEGDLVEGSLTDLLTVANGIILGEGLAAKLGVTTGDGVIAVSPAGTVLRAKIVGVFNTGITTMDNTVAYTLLKKAQVLQNRAQVVNQIRLRLADVTQAQDMARRIETRFGYRTEAWQESNRNVLGIFVIQNGIMYSTTGAILVVAAFGIFNIIATVVLEKSRDIAILKSIGLEERDIQLVFLTQGLILGVSGALLGWGVGWGLLEILANIKFNIEGFIRSQGFYLSYAPANFIVASLAATVSAVLAAYLPARRAAGLNPVDIIRGAA